MKKIIGMYFRMKNYLKSNHYHTVKHAINKTGFKNVADRRK